MTPMNLKGWMIDAARLPEPLVYYRRLINFCADWGFNAILFRLTDDQGSALRFASCPQIAAHPHAFTPEELADLAGYAAERGIDLIPEIESFGHTGCITRSPAYAHLLDDDVDSPSHFTGLIPNHADTLALMADLYREVAAIFPSRYLHAGCDEVNWGGSPTSRAAIEANGRAAVWTEYLNHLNALARENGKELMVWADHVLHHEPRILDGLDREVILVDWNYWDETPRGGQGRQSGPADAAVQALERGFRVVGAPAWGWCRWSVHAGASQLANIDAYADVYRQLEDPGVLGVIVTNWVPSRFVQRAIWDAPAYAGMALNDGSQAARTMAFARLVSDHFGAAWDSGWQSFFDDLYTFTPPRRACSQPEMQPFQPVTWASDAELAQILADERQASTDDAEASRTEIFRILRDRLARCAAGARRNLEDLRALDLALAVLEQLHSRSALVGQAYVDVRSGALSTSAADLTIQDVARADAELLGALEKDWRESRFDQDPAATQLLPALSTEDQVLFSLRRAAEYSASIAAQPGRFWQLLRAQERR